jgi:hypothetical protein
LSLAECGEIKYADNRQKRNMRTTSKKKKKRGDKSVREIKE